MSESLKRVKVSVKKLVEFSCRRGDLNHEGVAGPTAQEGQAAHRRLQKLRAANESAEVKVTANIQSAHYELAISGRVDLLKSEADNLAIGEIKSCYAPVEKIPADTKALHWAQLKVYGYCVLNSPDYQGSRIALRLIWANVITDEVSSEETVFELTELEEFTTTVALRYLQWMDIVLTQQSNIVSTAKALTFPHADYREGQRKMASAVYIATRDKKSLLCEAPTGIGKTVSTLFPAAKALGEELVESVVYLTAKTSGRQSANQALQQLTDHGLFITAITITSKKTTCHCSNGTCKRDENNRCPLTLGFFDRLPDAREHLLKKGVISPQCVDQAAHQFNLCPFELTLQMLPWVSVVICDYNYVFDPLVRLSHFNEHANKKLLLVDEAHNLTDRARSMYSAQLNRMHLLQAGKECGSANDFLGKAFKRVAAALDRLAKQSPDEQFNNVDSPKAVTKAVAHCAEALANTLENQQPLTELQADVAKELYRYLAIEALFGDHHRTLTTQFKSKGGKQVTVKLQCLNATARLHSTFKQFKASAVFSATLRPQHFFRESLGLPDDTLCLSLPSPFATENQSTCLCSWIDTRYRARESSIDAIVELAYHVYQSKPGNYQIFFPSYAFMDSVHREFTVKYPQISTIMQQRGSSDAERREFLNTFDTQQSVLAFAIMGGIYGEGVDYVGDKLIGVIIVGTGLASIDMQQKLIEEDFTTQGMNGFDYGSRYPGFTRVLQTAGRVIRSEQDKGIVVLVDQRFGSNFYQQLYPDHWHLTHCKNLQELNGSMNDFWAQHFSLTP